MKAPGLSCGTYGDIFSWWPSSTGCWWLELRLSRANFYNPMLANVLDCSNLFLTSGFSKVAEDDGNVVDAININLQQICKIKISTLTFKSDQRFLSRFLQEKYICNFVQVLVSKPLFIIF